MNSADLAKLLAGAFGIIISILFTILPKVSDWYYSKVGEQYRGLVMAGIGLVVSVLLYLFSCVWPIEIPGVVITCGNEGIVTILLAFVIFMTTNQVTYMASPESPAKARLAGG